MTVDDRQLTDVIRHISDSIPFNHHLGFRVETFEPTGCTVAFDRRPEHVGNVLRDILHGGVISAVLDFVGGLTALASLLAETDAASIDDVGRLFAGFGTIDLRVDYLRPGSGKRFVAGGVTLRAGRRVAVTRMELHNEEGTLIAVGTGSYVTG